MRAIIAILTILLVQTSYGETIRKGFTPEQEQWMTEQNEMTSAFRSDGILFDDPDDPLKFDWLQQTTVRPFAEYEDAGYLIFSSSFDFQSRNAKRVMAQNLPEGVTLVVFTYSKNSQHVRDVKDSFKGFIDEDRLKVIYLPGAGRGFWARDGVPVPVWRQAEFAEDTFTVVDAVYYHNFEADKEVSDYFSAALTSHQYYYEGGNFMPNAKNACLVVNKQATSIIPDSIFKDHYGCNNLLRLPFIKGIGHADESVKFIDDETVMTDAPSYKPLLEEAGYKVVMLPRPKREYETYVNALIVNGVVYVPIFDQATDEEALQVYRDAGFDKVIGINSLVLSNDGAGSLHCITMTYPKVSFSELLDNVEGEAL